jgi:hypothetical protein
VKAQALAAGGGRGDREVSARACRKERARLMFIEAVDAAIAQGTDQPGSQKGR